MDEVHFQREKLRREAQELINSLDEARTAFQRNVDEQPCDLVAALRVSLLGATAKQYVEAVTDKAKGEDVASTEEQVRREFGE